MKTIFSLGFGLPSTLKQLKENSIKILRKLRIKSHLREQIFLDKFHRSRPGSNQTLASEIFVCRPDPNEQVNVVNEKLAKNVCYSQFFTLSMTGTSQENLAVVKGAHCSRGFPWYTDVGRSPGKLAERKGV